MKSRALVVVILTSVVSTFVSAQSMQDTYKNAATLTNVWLSAQQEYEKIPSITAAVVKDQEVLWQGIFGWANTEQKVVVNANTTYSICSTSKIFTATAIMQLIDEGKLQLDDKIKDLLPELSFIQKYPHSNAIKIKDLLTHRSGLPRDTNHGYWGGPDHPFPSKKAFYNSLAQQETTNLVGERASYSNVGYALLGLIIEKVTKTTY